MADPESSVESVISNDDLLKEILVRLPVLSLILFKSVSKHWLSLIRDVSVTFRRKLDPISGLFLKKLSFKYYSDSISYEFVALDVRFPICRSLATKFTFGPEVRHKSDIEILESCNGLLKSDIEILDSCNGLLLCRTFAGKLYVYNPSITNMFKVLPEPDNVTRFNNFPDIGGLKMAFDPTKSPHYKVIYAEPFEEWIRIHTYSSETGNWSLCGHQFPELSFVWFKYGVYWNDAICWINGKSDIFKLDIMFLTALQTPLTLNRRFYECKLFESRGCLLLVRKDNSRHFTIYEKGSVYSEWSVKCIVNLSDTVKPFYKRWSIYKSFFCIVLGEREEDSFLVMELDKKVVQYKFVSKTLSTISDLGPDVDLVEGFQFIPSFANV